MPIPSLLERSDTNVHDQINRILTERLYPADAGTLTKSLSGLVSPYSLTEAEALNAVLKFTSASEAETIIIPVYSGASALRVIWNNCGFTLTIKGSATDTGETVVNGVLALLIHDGTNVRKVAERTANTLHDGLIAHWTLDEASGTRFDSKGVNNLTDNNTVTGAAGKVGTSSQFTAANSEYLSIADNADLSTGDIDFSLAGWVYFDTITSTRALVGKWVTTGQVEYIIQFESSTNKINFYVFDGTSSASVAASTTQTTGTWYFVVAYHDSVNNLIGISINNAAFNTAAHTTGVLNGTSAFEMGRNSNAGGNYHNGRLDSWDFYKKVLSAGEITSLWNGGNGLPWPY